MPIKPKIIRTATVALSLDVLLPGQLAFLNNHFEVIGVSGDDHHLQNVKEREKIAVRNIKMARQISPFQDLISLIKLYLLFKKEKPQIVHSITPKAGLLSMTAAYFAGVPVRIHTFTGLLFPYKSGFFQKLLLTMDKVLCGFSTHIIPEGQGVKNDLIKFKVTQKPLQIIANGNVNGININYFDPKLFSENDVADFKTKYKINSNDIVFVFIGRKVKDKGNEELIEAFSEITKKHTNCKLLYIGPFEKNDALSSDTMNLIESLIKDQKIINFGFEKDIRLFLKVSDILILPSYREGFPNVILQALAMETPCIATNISGCNEVILDNTNGFIINKQNVNELFLSMEKYITQPELIKTHKNNCRQNICNKFANEIIWNDLLKFYTSALINDKLENQR